MTDKSSESDDLTVEYRFTDIPCNSIYGSAGPRSFAFLSAYLDELQMQAALAVRIIGYTVACDDFGDVVLKERP